MDAVETILLVRKNGIGKAKPYAVPEKIVRQPKIANEIIASLIAGGEIEIVEQIDWAGPIY